MQICTVVHASRGSPGPEGDEALDALLVGVRERVPEVHPGQPPPGTHRCGGGGQGLLVKYKSEGAVSFHFFRTQRPGASAVRKLAMGS